VGRGGGLAAPPKNPTLLSAFGSSASIFGPSVLPPMKNPVHALEFD